MRWLTIAWGISALLANGAVPGILALASDPLRVTGLARVYCTNSKVVKARLANTSNFPVFVSLYFEKRNASGEWEDYVTDILQTDPYSKKARVLTIDSGKSLDIEWRPPRTDYRPVPFGDGSYRLVVYTTRSLADRGSRQMLEFAVSPAGCQGHAEGNDGDDRHGIPRRAAKGAQRMTEIKHGGRLRVGRRSVVGNRSSGGASGQSRRSSLGSAQSEAYPSSTWRSFRTSVSDVNGLCRNAMPGFSTPCRAMASSVYPDM